MSYNLCATAPSAIVINRDSNDDTPGDRTVDNFGVFSCISQLFAGTIR